MKEDKGKEGSLLRIAVDRQIEKMNQARDEEDIINNIEKKKIYVNDMTDITDALFVFLQFGIVLYNYIALISTIENSGIKINALNDKDIITLLKDY